MILLLSGFSRYNSYQKLNLQNVINQKPKTKNEKLYYNNYRKSHLKVEDLYHWVIIPTFQDPYEMLKDSFESIKKDIVASILTTLGKRYRYNHRRLTLESIIQRQVYRVSGYFCEKKRYKSYVFRW